MLIAAKAVVICIVCFLFVLILKDLFKPNL